MAVGLFRRIERAAKRRDLGFRWYTPLEEERLKTTITSWHWQGTCLEVAGDVLTKTVQDHPFPNANHRTSLFLVIAYLDAVGISWPHYNLQGQGIDTFHADTRPFVHQSKYLLQLLRHRTMIQIAYEEGYTHLLLTGDEKASIQEAELEASLQEIRDKHARAAQRLIKQLTHQRDQPKLLEENEIGLREWVKHNQA